jgi:hypothetical protein
MSTALRRKVGSPRPFGSFLAMRKEQYKIKRKLILTKNKIGRFRCCLYFIISSL